MEIGGILWALFYPILAFRIFGIPRLAAIP
jgi:hypothetical protein